MLQASQVLTDLETARFDREDKLEPQVEMMTSNAYYCKFFDKWGGGVDNCKCCLSKI